jgi:hypothetical protein
MAIATPVVVQGSNAATRAASKSTFSRRAEGSCRAARKTAASPARGAVASVVSVMFCPLGHQLHSCDGARAVPRHAGSLLAWPVISPVEGMTNREQLARVPGLFIIYPARMGG